MSDMTAEWCAKAGYVVLASFIAIAVILFFVIWMRSYWRERDEIKHTEMLIKKARAKDNKACEHWAALADDRIEEITELIDKVTVLEKENDMLKKLLLESERRRLSENK